MHGKSEDSVRAKMESLRLICDREIEIQQQKMDSVAASFQGSLQSVHARAQETVQNQGKLGKMKANLREAEDELVKVLSIKTRKEAKQMVTRDSKSAAKARIEELKRIVQAQRARRDEYSTVISQQSLASEEKANQGIERKREIQEAISWYNRVLGFHIEGGHGVKFTFKNINIRNLNEEYSFTIRHAHDSYTLLDCDPHLDDIKELIHELNKTNGLFKFVRIMREKFQQAAMRGLLPQFTSLHQDSSTISTSGPVLSVSTDRSESPTKNEHQIQYAEIIRHFKKANRGSESPAKTKEHHIEHGEVDRHSKKVSHGRGAKPTVLSPESASSLRRSPRLMVKK